MSDRFFLNHRDPARRRRDRTPLARRLMQPSERTITSRQLRQDIVSLAGLIGRPVLNQAGDEVGRVADLLAKVHGGETYPLVTGVVMRVGRRRAFLDAQPSTGCTAVLSPCAPPAWTCASSSGVTGKSCWPGTSWTISSWTPTRSR